jgi:putative pyoverdin transport system ATP-binding/permease protein
LSLPAFVICVIFLAIAIAIHFESSKELYRQLHLATAKEGELFTSLTDLLNGFKEVKINARRRDDLLDDIAGISHATARIKINTQNSIATHIIFSQAAFYLLLATIVFLGPRFTPAYIDVLVKLTTAVLFLMGPISVLTGSIPILSRANTSAENIFALESALKQPADRPARRGKARSFEGFREIAFESVSFTYPDRSGETPFTVGPIDVSLRAGEITFIEGGNGSGKSTFLKLLTGLYYPTTGLIRVDQTVVNEANRDAYRDLISAIFSDYHLFKRLYGLRNLDHQIIDRLLREMELENKTALLGDQFQTIELSSGQKKRLALLVSYLEDKPLLIFDEWAADQDPIFRKKFYEQLLQELKAKGKTVIAVSHDDRYFDAADTLLKMREGRLFVERQGKPA